MKKSFILICLLVFSSCGKQEVGDRDRNYRDDNGYDHDHYHDHDDDYDRDDRRNHWWPW